MPRNTLTKDQIIRTAVELLDDEGLEGLNMRSLGKRLDSAATAVYWHVKNKDDLVQLVGDEVWDEIELADPEAVGWRSAIMSMAVGLREMCVRHPWLVQAFGSYLFYGPAKARYDDHCLAVYEGAGFTPPEADRAAAGVFTFVLGNVLGTAATASLTRRLSRDDGDPDQRLADFMAKAREVAEAYPRLRSRLESPSAEFGAAPDDTFTHGLHTLLDGYEHQLTARRAS
ncbi:TetR/AcrR family transcriptional regulator C-terminal domain-containing protein [Streptomyces sp. NPDC127108]|uniref:TetR/AcrR family transcriptional regulator C-terminal domain-containing protein n=1 Tax=Streptomyces sp. NPDC127108 TaxID=3345361 RepID=UPI00363A0658